MARNQGQEPEYGRFMRRIFLTLFLIFCFGLFLFWRIDNTRAEYLRLQVADRVVPSLDRVMSPLTGLSRMFGDFQSLTRVYEQNEELRRELQTMKAWREAALQLDQENARLRELNNVRLNPELSVISGQIMADAGSPFRQSVLINLGRRDQVRDGWAVMDGLGLVGRISGLGQNTSRVLMISDSASRIPVFVKPSGQRAIMSGDNTNRPGLEFLENSESVLPGDRVVTSGDGGVFPAGLLIGQVWKGADGRFRVNPSADFQRLEIVRVLRHTPNPPIAESGRLIGPQLAPQADQSENHTEGETPSDPDSVQP